jgi:hypothetical protein
MNKFRPIKTAAAFHCHRYGIALIWTALVLLVLILLIGLSLDTAKVYLASHQLQNAADAAALAGARIVRIDPNGAREQAQYISSKNRTQGDSVILDLNTDNADPNGDIIIGHYYPSIDSFVRTVPTDSNGYPRPNAVRAVARRMTGKHDPIPLIFGPLAKVMTANVSNYAIAIAEGGLGAGLIVLSEDCGTQPSLSFDGGPTVEIQDGGIQVNMPTCPDCDAIVVNGQATVYAEEINLVSKCDSTNGYIFDPATGLRVTTDQPRIPDPYINLPAPPDGNTQAPADKVYKPADGETLQPGYYPGGITVGGNINVNFAPGIYVIDGDKNSGGLTIGGAANTCAKRVMFYIKGGNVKITGGSGSTGSTTITEIDSNDPGNDCNDNPVIYTQGDSYVAPYNGMAIFQSRTNELNADISGGSEVDVRGTIYFPHNHLDLGGTPSSLGIQVIAYTLTIHGTGTVDKLIINYDGRNRTPANRSYLVK